MNGRWTELTVKDDTIISDIEHRSRHLFVGVLMTWRAPTQKNMPVTLPVPCGCATQITSSLDDSTRQKKLNRIIKQPGTLMFVSSTLRLRAAVNKI
ncbi:unnamed protein product, partial [Ectocarpus sp. 12 AP-2014]